MHEVAEPRGGYSPADPSRSTTASSGNTTRRLSSTARPTGRIEDHTALGNQHPLDPMGLPICQTNKERDQRR
jgi:hypothetical protein